MVVFAIENLLFNLTNLIHRRNFHRTNRVAVVTARASPDACGAFVVFFEPIFGFAVASVGDRAVSFGEGVGADKFRVDFAGVALRIARAAEDAVASLVEFRSLLWSLQKFAFWTLVVIVILQAALFSVAIAQWAMSLWSSTKKTYEDERPDTGTEMESQRDLKLSTEFPKQAY